MTRPDPLAYLSTELDTLRQQGLHRSLRILEQRQQATTQFDGRTVVNLSSNNYLGLTTHPRLIERAIAAIKEFGVGSGSVRTIAGTMAIHMELERRLARVQAHRSRGRLPERLHGQRWHRLLDPQQGRRRSSPTS